MQEGATGSEAAPGGLQDEGGVVAGAQLGVGAPGGQPPPGRLDVGGRSALPQEGPAAAQHAPPALQQQHTPAACICHIQHHISSTARIYLCCLCVCVHEAPEVRKEPSTCCHGLQLAPLHHATSSQCGVVKRLKCLAAEGVSSGCMPGRQAWLIMTMISHDAHDNKTS